MTREFRFTIPGIFFLLPFLVGYFRLGVLGPGGDQTVKIAALLGVVLLSFAAGFPVSLGTGLWFHDRILPTASRELRELIVRRYGNRFQHSRTIGMMVSTLHHQYLDERVLEFLQRRQTFFYMAMNSVVGLVSGTVLFSIWQALRLAKPSDFRWCYEPPDVLFGATFIALAVSQAMINYQHHHRLIEMVEPLLLEKLATNACPVTLPTEVIGPPQFPRLWCRFAVACVILCVVLSIVGVMMK